MSSPGRVTGDSVFCHVCQHRWDRQNGGLQCPSCESEFVEIMDEPSNTQAEPMNTTSQHLPQSPPLPHPLRNHNPWAPDPDEDDISSFEFNSGRGPFHFSFSRTYTIGGSGRGETDPIAMEVGRNFESMVTSIMGLHDLQRSLTTPGQNVQFPPQQTRTSTTSPHELLSMLFQGPSAPNRAPDRPTNPLDLISILLNSANARSGDAVWSQEAFDRVMTQLMEQNQGSSAPGPASENAINSLQQKAVTEEMLGSDGMAECSICMDNVQIGDEVTVLPCSHWFHKDCVVSWLKEHDTCPHCRKSISATEGTSPQPTSSRRRSSRRSSSVASPLSPSWEDSSNQNTHAVDSPSGLRDARTRFYGNRSESDSQRPRPARHSSSRSDRQSDGGSGSVSGWIRSRLTFS